MEIESIKYNDGKHRFAIERIDGSESEFRFTWRGNKKSKDGFLPRPANFEWHQLGQLIRKAFDSGEIKESEINDFLRNLLDLKIKK
jgi:hypothetical protein